MIREVSFKDLKVDDFLLIRDPSDRDVIESEAKLKFKDPNDYEKLKLKSRKWFNVLINTKIKIIYQLVIYLIKWNYQVIQNQEQLKKSSK